MGAKLHPDEVCHFHRPDPRIERMLRSLSQSAVKGVALNRAARPVGISTRTAPPLPRPKAASQTALVSYAPSAETEARGSLQLSGMRPGFTSRVKDPQ